MVPSKLRLRIQNLPINRGIQQGAVIVHRLDHNRFTVTDTGRLTHTGDYRTAEAASPQEAARLVREMES